MSTYQEIIGQVADQWVAAFKRTEDAVSRYAENVPNARPNFEVPGLPTPESLAEINQTLTEKLPKPSEIVAATFALASRLLTDQRDLAQRQLLVVVQGDHQLLALRQERDRLAERLAHLGLHEVDLRAGAALVLDRRPALDRTVGRAAEFADSARGHHVGMGASGPTRSGAGRGLAFWAVWQQSARDCGGLGGALSARNRDRHSASSGHVPPAVAGVERAGARTPRRRHRIK
mgnify:CR=1 FL=1